MNIFSYIISKLDGLWGGLQLCFLYFVLPTIVLLLGCFWRKKRKEKNQPTKLINVIFIIAEIVSLIPWINITFFSDGDFFAASILIVFLPIILILFLPVILPFVCIGCVRKRKKENKSICSTVLTFLFYELLVLAFDICWIMKDYSS